MPGPRRWIAVVSTVSTTIRLESARRREDHRHAGRVAVGLAMPGLLLLIFGRPELMLYVVFGSFAGMYGRLAPPVERLRHQLHGGGMLITGVALGVTLSEHDAHPAVLVLGVAAFATVGSIGTDWLRLRPGGPFFGIFALGATASVTPGLVDPWAAVAICAATAAFAVGLGCASGLWRYAGVAGIRVTAEPWWRGVLRTERALPLGSGAQALRYALATAGAGCVGLTLGLEHANWAMAAAAVPLAVISSGEGRDIRAVIHRGFHRLAGTAVGLVVTAIVLLPLPSPTLLALIVMVLLFPTELFMSRHYGVALGFFTPLIMIMTDLAAPSPPLTMVTARGLDTVIGVGAGIAAAALIVGPKSRAIAGGGG